MKDLQNNTNIYNILWQAEMSFEYIFANYSSLIEILFHFNRTI